MDSIPAAVQRPAPSLAGREAGRLQLDAIMKLHAPAADLWSAVTRHGFLRFGDMSPKQGRVPCRVAAERRRKRPDDSSWILPSRWTATSRLRKARTSPAPSTHFRTWNKHGESQRDSGSKPRVARHELPWENRADVANPNGVASVFLVLQGHNPVGVADRFLAVSQGSSCLATPGWRIQSLWDWRCV